MRKERGQIPEARKRKCLLKIVAKERHKIRNAHLNWSQILRDTDGFTLCLRLLPHSKSSALPACQAYMPFLPRQMSQSTQWHSQLPFTRACVTQQSKRRMCSHWSVILWGTRLLRDEAVSLPLVPGNQTSPGTSHNTHYNKCIVSLCHRPDIFMANKSCLLLVYEDNKKQKHNVLFSAKCKLCWLI